MNCEQIQTLVHAHHDGELDAANTLELERHLADCQKCSILSRNLAGLRSRLGDESLRFRAPATLRSSIRAAAASAVETEREHVPSRPAWARHGLSAATAALAIFLAIQFWPARQEQPLLAELTSSHVRSLMANHLTDVLSSDQHTVKPWFDGKLDFAPPVKDLKDRGFPLIGGRLDYVAERPVAALAYSRQKHLINLFIWPSGKGVAAPKTAARNGYHLIHWIDQGMEFWAVSDLNEQELMEFARMWPERR